MALFETTRRMDGHVIGGHSSNFIATIIAAINDWNNARVTRRSLAALSDQELDDIGLCRGDIELVAQGRF